ncbi:MAG: DUF1016 family protein [Deltaproteobacteria bacterium]|nr:DUF1016 family protein [Deltaproteobacteria bacterium]
MSSTGTFEQLISSIKETNRELTRQAKLAVNTSLTLRNWLIGCYIEEYQLHGADRAEYGDGLLPKLSAALSGLGVNTVGRRQLYNYLAFYRTYPEIVRSLSAQSLGALPAARALIEKVHTASAQSTTGIMATLPPRSAGVADQFISRLSYSHFKELVVLDDSPKRRFYEDRCIEGVWSVRELKRQIASLFYERTALSRNKEALKVQTDAVAEVDPPILAIRDPYVFEFLGLKPAEVMGESELEDALLDKLQSFLLELGHGFCFEARQKRILIGETYNFVDLVFYHRILKCHVLVELKVGTFTHEHIGQLNTYVSWYADNEITKGDGLPIGILLCTEKDHTVIKYALAGMSNQLFVSKYQVALPTEDEMRRLLGKMNGYSDRVRPIP